MTKFSRIVLESSSEKLPDGTIRTEDDGDVWYKKNGRFHRTDGPAIIYSDGTECWYQNSKLHRIDGPAITYRGMPQHGEYWVHGKNFSKKEFEKHFGED